jgi:methyl-accepting chemotaxis protein
MSSSSVKKTMILGAVLVASLLLTGSAVTWWTNNLQRQADDEVERFNQASLVFRDTRFNVVQIQQFLTDAGATGEGGDDYRRQRRTSSRRCRTWMCCKPCCRMSRPR